MHPNINNFRSAVRKKEITRMKINEFKAWMNNPNKFPADEREEAQKALDEAERLLADGSGNAAIREREYKNRENVNSRNNPSGRNKPSQTGQLNKYAAPASGLGGAFHNPYTFISFPAKGPERHAPTPLTIDECEPDRMTGFINLEIETLSPLLSPGIEKVQEANTPKWCSALRIGKNVIVPASSVRGVLRTLTAIISGSALDFVDDDLWLCQGRDAKLDDNTHSVPIYLAEVIKPGSEHSDGIVKFARAKLIETKKLRINDRDRTEYIKNPRKIQMWINNPDASYITQREKYDPDHPWRVKVSGKKVGDPRRNYHEGAFRPDEAQTITLRAQLWRDYIGRHRNADKKELRTGDIIWLEPNVLGEEIKDERDVKSIQWARWGRAGVNFKQKLKASLGHMMPDSIKNDGLVDITSDLFGSIPMPENNDKASYEAFAARIRPENLVFDAPETFWNEMPPLSSPHPGCKAFYVENNDLDAISLMDPPKGYKVYRTSKHTDNAPWLYKTQPIFQDGKPKEFRMSGSTTRKCELVQSGAAGKLKIAFKALNKKELALLLLVLSCDLRIGGGKPVGLGHCIVKNITVYDENCDELYAYQPSRAEVPADLAEFVSIYKNRANLYCKTQEPVENMLYPRARNGFQRSGMCWFSQFAVSKKNVTNGLQIFRGYKAQSLPVFDPFNPEADQLFGYDYVISSENKNKGVNYSQNKQSRIDARKQR